MLSIYILDGEKQGDYGRNSQFVTDISVFSFCTFFNNLLGCVTDCKWFFWIWGIAISALGNLA